MTDKSSVYLNAMKVESVMTGLQFLGVGVASTTWLQADAALFLLRSQRSGLTTDSPEVSEREFLKPSAEIHSSSCCWSGWT